MVKPAECSILPTWGELAWLGLCLLVLVVGLNLILRK